MNEQIKAANTRIFAEIKEESFEVLHAMDASTENAGALNRELLLRILGKNSGTEYGKKYGFSGIGDVDAYRRQVPLSVYSDYEPCIERMAQKGEQNLLTADPPVYFACSSGSTGKPKNIPLTEEGLRTFLDYTTATMPAVISEFYRTTRRTDFEYGKECAVLSIFRDVFPSGIPYGSLSAAFMDDGDEEEEDGETEFFGCYETAPEAVMRCGESADMKYLHARYALAEPDVVYITSAYIPSLLEMMVYIRDHHGMLVRDIREGMIDPGIQMPAELRKTLEDALEPDPDRADALEKEFAKGFDRTVMKRIWPGLAAVCTIWSGNYLPYTRKLQQYSGRTVPYYAMSYLASEGVFGIARHPFDPYYCILPSSCFYEFIPVDREEEDDPCPATLLLDEVEEGRQYELVITNQSGLYRYRMGDVIRVVGFYNETPMVEFCYRKKNLLSLAGEKVTEDDLISAVRELERRSGIRFTDFCVFPDQAAEPCRYVVYAEPEESVPAERAAELGAVLHQELCRANENYDVLKNTIGIPKIVFLRPQAFRRHKKTRMEKYGITDNQMKTVRVLSTPEQVRFFEAEALSSESP